MKGIGYFLHQKSGCYLYRIKQPMDVLQTHGIPTVMMELNKDVILTDLQSVQVYGIYPFSFGKVLKFLKDEGKNIVYDLDDALDFIEPTNPFYYSVKRDSASQEEIFTYADHITVSTQKIAEYARTKTDKPITIIPNCFNPKDWTFTQPPSKEIRIGFAGSPTHVEDLLMVLPAIKNLQAKYPSLKFCIMGFGQTDYPTWLQNFRFVSPPEAHKTLERFNELMQEIKLEWVPYVDFDNYPQVLTNLGIDIGICPLAPTAFNKARSASKAMEYTLAGALALASDLEPYRDDESSVLVKDDEWEQVLEFAITHSEWARSEHLSHLKWIKENRDINTQMELLTSVYV